MLRQKLLDYLETQGLRSLCARTRFGNAAVFSNAANNPSLHEEDCKEAAKAIPGHDLHSSLPSQSWKEDPDPRQRKIKKQVVWKRDSSNVGTTLEPNTPRQCPIPVLARMQQGMGKFTDEPVTILGIETSCDDTAVGVVDVTRRVLGQAKASQIKEHKQAGGVIPRVARKYHKENIEAVTNMALEQSGRSLEEVGGIAVTVGPGMTSCLEVGVDYARELARKAKKPLIPIHHMEAHALTARLGEHIPFPHLVLLCSGGHCILAIAEHVNCFTLLGDCLDDSPGTVLDMCARMMCLDRHPETAGLPGGVAIERLAQNGNPKYVTVMDRGNILAKMLDCNFSFSGLRGAVYSYCDAQKNLGWDETSPIPLCEHLAAAVQKLAVDHLLVRTQRALMYCRLKRPQLRHMVVSGGVASNQTLRSRLMEAMELFDFDLHVPSPDLCTDNGVMIAWAAIERLMALEEGSPRREDCSWMDGDGVCWTEEEMEALRIFHRLPLGKRVSEEIKAMKLRSSNTMEKMLKNIVRAKSDSDICCPV